MKWPAFDLALFTLYKIEIITSKHSAGQIVAHAVYNLIHNVISVLVLYYHSDAVSPPCIASTPENAASLTPAIFHTSDTVSELGIGPSSGLLCLTPPDPY